MLELGLKIVASYLLGSLSGALLLGPFFGVDLRTVGSGNAGATNAMRARGPRFALWVVLIDIAKGVIAATAIARAPLPGVPFDPDLPRAWIAPICGAAVVIGHVYPYWFDLRGGKGAATLLGVCGALAPELLVPVAIVWLATLTMTGYVGLATVLAAAIAPVYVVSALNDAPLLVFTAIMAIFIAYTHRANLARLRAGTEDRKERLMLRRRRKS
jgi:acyl phosphate:glycerol-3-phosphate acyltransferase